jgi:hypothetical protein
MSPKEEIRKRKWRINALAKERGKKTKEEEGQDGK